MRAWICAFAVAGVALLAAMAERGLRVELPILLGLSILLAAGAPLALALARGGNASGWARAAAVAAAPILGACAALAAAKSRGWAEAASGPWLVLGAGAGSLALVLGVLGSRRFRRRDSRPLGGDPEIP